MNINTIVFLFCLLPVSIYAYAEGEIESLRSYTYWENGNVKECGVYDVNGYLRAKAYYRYDGNAEKIEKYDLLGNKIEQAFYDEKGKLKTGIDGWAATRWNYDGSRLVSQTMYDENGRPLERKLYSESGRLILRQYREDLSLDTYEALNMALLLGKQNIAYRDSRTERE
ncbi:MAG: hypothetical protein Q8N91_02345 [Candidatus Omnitrophota bacterium]|nr:hypothetical protein [Candidatus Omnitrophota bacterium]